MAVDTAEKRLTALHVREGIHNLIPRPAGGVTTSDRFTLMIHYGGFSAAFYTVKVWTGSGWELKPIFVWTGSSWENKPVKTWNGSSWV